MIASELSGRRLSVLCFVLIVLMESPSAFSDEDASANAVSVTVVGSDRPVQGVRKSGRLLLNAAELAAALDQEAKIVSNGRLLTFCRTGDEELCIPFRLHGVHTSGSGEAFCVDASVLARALHLTIEDSPERIVVRRAFGKAARHAEVSAFNAAWGEGRGFRPGQTLPDIPLMAMQGREVRFSEFLGKQYIIYCWASW